MPSTLKSLLLLKLYSTALRTLNCTYRIQITILHIGRALYYGSYKSPRVLPFAVGVVILA